MSYGRVATQRTKLQLHVEMEDTAMLVNSAKGYGPRQIINLALSKVAMVKERTSASPIKSATLQRKASTVGAVKGAATLYTWHDGSSLSLTQRHEVDSQKGAGRSMKDVRPPPLLRRVATVTGTASSDLVSFIGQQPPDTFSFFSVFGEEASAAFTDSGPGVVFLAFCMELQSMLLWPERHHPPPKALVTKQDISYYHLIVPSLFHAIVGLKQTNRDVLLVLRTAGPDLALAAAAVDAFACHEHPVFAESLEYLETLAMRCRDKVHWSTVVEQEKPRPKAAPEVKPAAELAAGTAELSNLKDQEGEGGAADGSTIKAGLLGSEGGEAAHTDQGGGREAAEVLGDGRGDAAEGERGDHPDNDKKQKGNAKGQATKKAGWADAAMTLKSGFRLAADVHSEIEIYKKLLTFEGVVGIQDSYERWEESGKDSRAGKQLWFTQMDNLVHPMFFDANLNSTGIESPVGIRARATLSDPFRSLNPSQLTVLDKILVFKVDLIQAILNPNYFLAAIELCERNLVMTRPSILEQLASLDEQAGGGVPGSLDEEAQESIPAQ